MHSYLFVCLLFILMPLSLPGVPKTTIIKNNLKKATEEYRESERALNKIEADLASLEKDRYEKTSVLSTNVKDLGRLIHHLYILNTQSKRLEILITTPPQNYIESLLIVQQAVHSLEHNIITLKSDLETIEKTATSSQELRQQLKEKIIIYEKRSKDLEQLLKKKETHLAQEVQRRKTLYTKVSHVASKCSTLAELIQHLNQGVISPLTDQKMNASTPMERPIEGPILVPYGQKHSLSPAGVGIVFRARPGAPIVSPVQGVILFAGPFRTYKNLLILSDSRGYHYILTGLHRLEASLGQHVMAGDIIARMDSTRKGYLYFEIRSRGSPVPPPFSS